MCSYEDRKTAVELYIQYRRAGDASLCTIFCGNRVHGHVVESFAMDRLKIGEATSRFHPVGVKHTPKLKPEPLTEV